MNNEIIDKTGEGAYLDAIINDPSISAETKIELQQRKIKQLQESSTTAPAATMEATKEAMEYDAPIKKKRSVVHVILMLIPKAILYLFGMFMYGLLFAVRFLSKLLKLMFVISTLAFALTFVMMITQRMQGSAIWMGAATVVSVLIVAFADMLPIWVEVAAIWLFKTAAYI